MKELQEIVQRMIDAGESEDNIKLVIEEYTKDVEKTNGSQIEDATVEPIDTASKSENISSGFKYDPDAFLSQSTTGDIPVKTSSFTVINDKIVEQEDPFPLVTKAEEETKKQNELIKKQAEENFAKFKAANKDLIKPVQFEEGFTATIDYDNEESVEKMNNTLSFQFFKNNQDFKKIVQGIEENNRDVLLDKQIEIISKYDYDSKTGLLSDEDYEKAKLEYNDFFNSLVLNNSRVKDMLGVYMDKVNDLHQTDENRYVVSKNTPYWIKSLQLQSEAGLSVKIPYFTAYNSVNKLITGAKSTALATVTDAVYAPTYKHYNAISKQAENEGWDDQTEGYVNPDNGFFSTTRGPASGYRNKTTWGEARVNLENKIKKHQKDYTNKLNDVLSEREIQNAYQKADFVKMASGENSLDNLKMMVADQIPMMIGALVSFGTIPAMSEGASVYETLMQQEARKTNPNFDELSQQDQAKLLYSVAMKDDGSIYNKSAVSGIIIGQLERVGAKATLFPMLNKTSRSIIRGQYKSFLKNTAKGTTSGSFSEALTEGLQTFTSSAFTGEFSGKEFVEAIGMGATIGAVMPFSGSVLKQTTRELTSTSRLVMGKLDAKSTEAFFNNQLLQLDRAFDKKEISKEDYDSKRKAMTDLKNNNSKIPRNFSQENKEKSLDILIKRQELEKQKESLDPNLTSEIDDQINSLNQELKEISNQEAEVKKAEKKGVTVGELRQEQFDKYFETTTEMAQDIKNKTGRDVFIEEGDNSMMAELLVDSGEFSTIEEATQHVDGTKGFRHGAIGQDANGNSFIMLNKESSIATGKVTTAAHEFLHAILFQTLKRNTQAQMEFGSQIINAINEAGGVDPSSDFSKRLETYTPSEGLGEEVATLLSESMLLGDVKFNETVFTKVQDAFRRFMLKYTNKEFTFDKSKDFYNFLKDYNKSLTDEKLRGKIINVATKGAKGKLITPVEDVKTDVETMASKEASDKVQQIYEDQGIGGAMDIIDQFAPIVNRLVQRRSEAPNFDRQLLTDEINTGERGIFDLIQSYKPESGVPLAAYINKFLPARAIEASRRVLGEEFTEDVTEARGVEAEKAVEQQPERRTKLKVLADQLNVADKVKSEVAEANIDPNALTNFKSVPNAAINTVGELLDIAPNKIKSKANLTASEVASAQRWFNKNARLVIDALPQGFDTEGQATGVPRTVLDALYTKREARAKTKAGLRTQVKRPNIKDSELLELVDIIDGKPTRNRNTSARVIALADLLGKVITNQELRKSNPSLQRIRSGMSDIMFSKGVDQNEEFETQATFLAGEIIDNGYDSVIEDGKLAIGYEASPSVVSFIKSIYEDGTIVEAEDVKFKQSIFKSNLIPKEVKEAYKTVGNLRYNKEALDLLHKDASVVAETLGPEIMNAIGYEVLGYKNRVMDPAAKKKDNGQPGDYYKKLESLKNKVNNKKVNLPKGLVIEDVNIMNIGVSGSVFKDVIKVLNKDISRSEKLTQLEKLAPKINNASVANLILAKHIAKTIINLTRAGRISTISAFNILQSQTSIVQGFRGLSGLDLITVADGSQKPSKNHPHYKRAVKYFKDSDKALQKMGYKGEHLGPNSNTMFKIAELIYDENADIDLSLNKAFRGHSQMLTSKYLTDVMDDKGGKNNDTDFKRVKFLDKVDIQESTSADGKSYEQVLAENEISKKLDELILQPAEIKEKSKLSKNISNVRPVLQYSKESRGMSTFDFDETLIIDGENFVTATKKGETVKIPSDKWPIDGPKYAAEGWKFDFSDFVNVRGGKEGPLLQKMRNQIKKYGADNVFVLTARMQEAAGPIHEWLKSQGINIPLENITGLGKSESDAKAQWFIDKYAEGYNDMYFVDDALPNVEAVKHVFDQLDVKGKSVQARLQFSKDMSSEFNKMLERTKDVAAEKRFSRVVGQKRGKNIGRYRFFVPPSAEDFAGLLYDFYGKGKQGDADMEFMKKALLDPFGRADREMSMARMSILEDYKVLRKELPNVKKKLGKIIDENTGFTFDNAIRVYLFDKAGYEVPGISKRDLEYLRNVVRTDQDLKTFADILGLISKKKEGYIEPGEYWSVETIASDLENIVNKIGRKQFLAEWIENKNIIFSPENMNKIEAIYGSRFRSALEDSLYRMENGTNRSKDRNYGQSWTNWVNGSVGAIMFFNARSAVLQTLSTVNFINFQDNNIFAAGRAFANQKQYWSDFSILFNSDFLKARRAGLQINVNEAELANAVAGAQNKAKAALAYLLKKGFLPTQIADSFAIASGGATFYRNRIKTYVKQGMNQKAAEEKAFLDFQEIAQETQQSSRPDRISQQQASPLGRLILAFANTPMQYNRLIKKSARDLINNRGDWKSNISRILYYGAIQNVIFSAMQSAIFALSFDDEEGDELDKRTMRVANTMIDTILRGSGVTGAAVATIKNTIMRFIQESEKESRADYGQVAVEVTQVSPPMGSKMRKLYSALNAYKFNRDIMGSMDTFDYNNPIWDAAANVTTAATNIPLDRLFRKTDNIREALNQENSAMQRAFLTMGWSSWDLQVGKRVVVNKGKKNEYVKYLDIKRQAQEEAEKKLKQKEKEEKKAKQQRCTAITSSGRRCKNMVNKPKTRCYAHD